MPKGAGRFEIGTADGETLHGVHVPPSHPSGERTLVLSFAGNAWNGQEAATYLHQIYTDADVIGFHYRGYRPSTGKPSAKALFADAPLIYDEAVSRVKPKRVVAVGLSIGTGVASHLATVRKLDGVILVTPFDSLEAVAKGQFPYLPIGAIFSHEMDSAAALSAVDAPVAIIAAEHDTLIVPERTDKLRQAVRRLSYDETISGAGHNDIYHRSVFQDAMRKALDALKS